MVINKYIDGNSAVAYAVSLAKAEVVAAYPITPQTKIVEKISEMISDGEFAADFIKVESEHSALSVCFGAASSGVRTFTATSSQGLAYMDEMLHYVSGARLPVVMVNVNRPVGPPWNILCDHQDSIARRDSGWIQCYVENAQEAYDTVLQAYRIAEDPRVLTPMMICYDAFVLSHTEEKVLLEEPEKMAKFLPPLQLKARLDINNPLTMAAGGSPEYYTEFRYAQQKAMENAIEVIEEVAGKFTEIFGRKYCGLVENYRTEDAQAILVVLGSTAGTIKDVIDEMRNEGQQVGLIRIRFLRPFPKEKIIESIGDCAQVGVIDRNVSYGYEGAVASEVKAALYNSGSRAKVENFICGLGGRDINKETIRGFYQKLLNENKTDYVGLEFAGLRCLK